MAFELPWYPHYVTDWLNDGSVREMEYAKRGLYHDIMQQQWLEEHLPADVERVRKRLSRPDDPAVADLAAILEAHFPVGQDGKRRNPRLAEVREEQLRISKRRREGGRAGGLAKARLGLGQVKSESDTTTQHTDSRDVENKGVRGKRSPVAEPQPTYLIPPDLLERLPAACHTSLTGLMRAAQSPISLASEIRMILDGGRGFQPTADHMAIALDDCALNGGKVTGVMLRSFVQKAMTAPNGHVKVADASGNRWEMLRNKAKEEETRAAS